MGTALPLVYVLSNGRSGSTLLDLLLGAHEATWSVGELQVLPWELRENRAPCGCGEPVERCDFWAPLVADRAFEAGPAPLHYFRSSHGTGRVLRPTQLLDLWRGRPRGRHRALAAAYAQRTADLLELVLPRAAARRGRPLRWLIDASKDPYRLLWLAASERFDLRVVHLARDPRAFVHSMTRGRTRGRLGSLLRFSLRWSVENALMARLVRRAVEPSRVYTLRYEDLAGRPEQALAELGAWLGLEDLGGALDRFRTLENHAIAGNQMRYGTRPVQLDEAWREQLTPFDRGLVTATTAPVRRRLGY
jgi:hypothetical protein